jgi:Eukaryotic cytochrome b561
MIFLIGTGVLSIGSVISMYLYSSSPHFHSPHGIFGLLVVISMMVQISLGIAADYLYDPYRTRVPIIDKVHWWTGRLVIPAAYINVILGILRFKEYSGMVDVPLISISTLFTAAGICSIIAGNYLFGSPVHTHVKRVSSEENDMLKFYKN